MQVFLSPKHSPVSKNESEYGWSTTRKQDKSVDPSAEHTRIIEQKKTPKQFDVSMMTSKREGTAGLAL